MTAAGTPPFGWGIKRLVVVVFFKS